MYTIFYRLLILILLLNLNCNLFALADNKVKDKKIISKSLIKIENDAIKPTEELLYYPLYSKIHDEYTPEEYSITDFGVTSVGAGFSKKSHGSIFNKSFQYQNKELIDDPMFYVDMTFSNSLNDTIITTKLGAGLVRFLDFSNYATSNKIKYSQHKSIFMELVLDIAQFINRLNISYIGKQVEKKDLLPWVQFFISNTSIALTNFWHNIVSGSSTNIPNLDDVSSTDIVNTDNMIKIGIESAYNIHLFTSNIGSLYIYLGGKLGLITSPFSTAENTNNITAMPIFRVKYENSFSAVTIGNDLLEVSFNISI